MNVDCDAERLGADLHSVDILARLVLGARRAEVELHVRNATSELRELVGLLGLETVLRLEPQRQPEQRE
jgi:hypothetical protein